MSQGDMTKDTENSTQLANSQNTEECEGTDMTIDDSGFTPVRQWWDHGKVLIQQLCREYTVNITRNITKSLKDLEIGIVELQVLAESTGDRRHVEDLKVKKALMADLLGTKAQDFYQDPYRSEHRDSKELLDIFYQGLPKFSSEDNAALEGSLVLEELQVALNTMPGGKAPGIDSLPVEFYKFFWKELGEDLLEVLEESCRERGSTPEQPEGAWILFKRGSQGPAVSLYWILEEPLVGGGRIDSSPGLALITQSKKFTTLKRLVDTAGPEFKYTRAVAEELSLRSLRNTEVIMQRWNNKLSEDELNLIKEYHDGTEIPDRGKGRELADMMERRKVDILCVQETRWKGSKARSIGAGFKLFYYGVDSKRNGVGVVLKEEFVRNVLEVKRVSDRVMSLKLEIEGVMLNVVSGYAPQVGCELEEKERFWSELDEVMESIPTGERVVIGADFNGHVGEGNTGDEEVMGKFGVKERNLEGQMVVDFAKRMDMVVVNTYFQKREEHRVTYKSGGRSTQVNYILCRRGNLKEISDCKVVVGECVARQHRMVVCRMTLMVCKKKRSETEKKTKWWKLKKEECCEEFRQKLRQALGGQVLLPDDWETTAEVIRETGRKVLGVSSGRRKEDKETWWWNEEVQDSIQRKRLAKKKWDMDRTEENRQGYKELQRRVKREVSKSKQKEYDELYTRLDTREGEKDLYRLARQRDREGCAAS
ncbi:hypothetical protein QTP86_002977 [Hemibagrus guttatus]|nr:hypothetical protein QTP86_002977 [Hemibagrus guttatus]